MTRAGDQRRAGRPTRAEAAALDEAVRHCALELFLERGFDHTSMDAIASAAGTTKASLYTRYPSKAALFDAVLRWTVQRRDWPEPEPPPPSPDDLEAALVALAEAAVRRALHPKMVQLARIAITQPSVFPELAEGMASPARWPRRRLVTDLLRRHAATGDIELADDPGVLAEHFLGLTSAVPARLASFGVVLGEAEQARRTRSAVALFVRSLRPGGAAQSPPV